jgi:hypothetical protein
MSAIAWRHSDLVHVDIVDQEVYNFRVLINGIDFGTVICVGGTAPELKQSIANDLSRVVYDTYERGIKKGRRQMQTEIKALLGLETK